MTDTDPTGVRTFAQRHPERLAIIDDFGTSWTYRDLNTRVDRLVSALRRRGLRQDDVIAVAGANRAEIPLVQQAAMRGGLFFTPLNHKLRPDEAHYILADSAAKILFVDSPHHELAAAASAGLDCRVILLDGAGDDSLAALLDAGSPDPQQDRYGAPLSYTSGTTGKPKAVVRKRTASHLAARAKFPLAVKYRLDHNKHLCPAPLHHGAAWLSVMYAMIVGSTTWLANRFDPVATLQRIAQDRITSAYMVPTMFHRLLLLSVDVRDAFDVSSLESVVHAGAPCPPAIKGRIIEWFGPVLYETYAATEAGGPYTICSSDEWLAHPGTVGKPPADLITIRDDDGAEVPRGTVGTIYASTLPGLEPFAYKDDPAKTTRAYHPSGQYTVGDIGYLDPEGWLFVTGRESDTIISGGVNIYPAEVEAILVQHPLVHDVAVIGAADPEWGERVVAVVELATARTAGQAKITDELLAYCRDGIAGYKVPKDIVIVDSLGRETTGKLRRDTVRDRVRSLL